VSRRSGGLERAKLRVESMDIIRLRETFRPALRLRHAS